MNKDSEVKVVMLKCKPNVWLNNRLDTIEETVNWENDLKKFLAIMQHTENMSKWEKDTGYRMWNLTNII